MAHSRVDFPSLKTLAAKETAKHIVLDRKEINIWKETDGGHEVIHQASLRLEDIKNGKPVIGSLLKRETDNKLFRIITSRMITETYIDDGYTMRTFSQKKERDMLLFGIEPIEPDVNDNNSTTTTTTVSKIFSYFNKPKDIEEIKWNIRKGKAEGFIWYLGGINLRYLDLKDITLKRMDFEGANFEGADLRRANISFCNFKNANFKWVDLRGARKTNPYMVNTNLTWSDFEGADVTGTLYNKYTKFQDRHIRFTKVTNLNKQDMVFTDSEEERDLDATIASKQNVFKTDYTQKLKIKW